MEVADEQVAPERPSRHCSPQQEDSHETQKWSNGAHHPFEWVDVDVLDWERGISFVVNPVDAVVQALVLVHQAVPAIEPRVIKQYDDADLKRQQAHPRSRHGEDVSEEGERRPHQAHKDGLV